MINIRHICCIILLVETFVVVYNHQDSILPPEFVFKLKAKNIIHILFSLFFKALFMDNVNLVFIYFFDILQYKYKIYDDYRGLRFFKTKSSFNWIIFNFEIFRKQEEVFEYKLSKQCKMFTHKTYTELNIYIDRIDTQK